MKKSIFIILLALAQTNIVLSQCEMNSDRENKKTYSVMITKGYSMKDGLEVLDFIQTSKYNQQGRETSYIFQHVTTDFKKTNNTLYYDSKGNLIREIRRNPKGEISDSILYKYDSNGNNIESAMWRKGSFDSYEVYQYDENCNLISDIAYTYDSSLWFHYTYTYDSNNNILTFTDVSHSGETESYERDSTGNILKHTLTDKEGNILFVKTSEIHVDKRGNITLVIWYNETGQIVGRDIYIYKKNVLMESKKYEGENLKSMSVYDKHGNIILEETYHEGEPTYKFTYEYVY